MSTTIRALPRRLPALLLFLSLSPLAWAQMPAATLTTIYAFAPCASCTLVPPNLGLVAGKDGVLYGSTAYLGSFGSGTVFSLTQGPTGAWTLDVLYSFKGLSDGGTDGAAPVWGVVMGNSGVLYGITSQGGTGSCQSPPTSAGPGAPGGPVIGCGTVFSLTPPSAPGGTWTEAIIWSYGLGEGPPGSLQIDTSGVLYVSTATTIRSFVPPTAPGGQWAISPDYTVASTQDQLSPGLVVSGGVVYGSRPELSGGVGDIFSASPPKTPGGAWSERVIYSAPGGPYVTAVDSKGVLYGAAGNVFSLTPPAQPGAAWTEATLYDFTGGSDGLVLTIGNGGVLYGSSLSQGSSCQASGACSTIFSLTPPATPGGPWAESTLYTFAYPAELSLSLSTDGEFYGVVLKQGSSGAVFSLKVAIPQPTINPGGLVAAASYTAPVAPGSIASVFGDFFVPAPLGAAQSPLPTSLSGLSLQFDSTSAAPLFFVSGGQVNLQVPWELAGQLSANLTATLNGQEGAPQTLQLAPFAPAIFAMNAEGSGQGAILDESNQLVDANNPATPGSTILQIYCTGLGAVSDPPPTGSPASLTQLSYANVTPQVTVSGVPADVLFSGLAPGYVGLYQVNARVPAGIGATNAAPVVILIEGVPSNTVTIAVE